MSLLLILLSGCEEAEWCESSDAQALRERNVSSLYFKTIHDVLTAKPDDPVALFAHRGGYHCEEMDASPENSLPNLEKAIRMGFDGFETDLWSTADGEFIIHHDETLDRTTNGTGNVGAIGFEESRKLRLKYPSGNLSDERIPTFRELLAATRGRMLILVELKGTSPERFVDIVEIARETEMLDQVFFWIDWKPDYAERLKSLLDSGLQEVRTNVLWRTRDMQALEDVVEKFDPVMVDIPPRQDELSKAKGYRTEFFGHLPPDHLALVKAAQNAGVKVFVSKVTTNAYLRGLEKEGVRGFMSRAPEVQLAYLVKRGTHP